MFENMARRANLPIFNVTTASQTAEATSALVAISSKAEKRVYYRTPVTSSSNGKPTSFTRFPCVKNGDGSPWPEACLFLLDRAKLNPGTLDFSKTLALDLAAYKSFLDGFGYFWNAFEAAEPYARPTYQYRAFILAEIASGRISRSTGSRRINSVIAFYRHIQKNRRFNFHPKHDPWLERTATISYRDVQGFKQSKQIQTTDLRIAVPTSIDPWGETIEDGGKLRPLPQSEQILILKALRELGNTEMTLMHEVALLTGARTQTVCTIRRKNFLKPPGELRGDLLLPCGPGTGIDTKNDRSKVNLRIPHALYVRMHIYAMSERARRRRDKSELGDSAENYLFLTQHGKPFYESKEDRLKTGVNGKLIKSDKIAQGLRAFVAKRVIPKVRAALGEKGRDFSYTFHDLRATFGMNYVDQFESRLSSEPELRKFVLAQLQELMWHRSPTTTGRYLNFRRNLKRLSAAQEGWANHLVELITGENVSDISTR